MSVLFSITFQSVFSAGSSAILPFPISYRRKCG
nr:MAG TPA: hypothetical protein [Caudoviricetes sp.]